MLNLSDKELDRLSREAASAHDPGEPTGAGSWPMLERRLDKEFGRVTPNHNPLRGFRRLSFYFAPAVLLLVGVSYYFIKQGKNNDRSTAAGPPGAVIKMERSPRSAPEKKTSNLTQNNADKSNSTPDNNHPTEPSSTPSTATAPTPLSSTAPASVPATAPGSVSAPGSATTIAGAKTPASNLSPSSGTAPGSTATRSTATGSAATGSATTGSTVNANAPAPGLAAAKTKTGHDAGRTNVTTANPSHTGGPPSIAHTYAGRSNTGHAAPTTDHGINKPSLRPHKVQAPGQDLANTGVNETSKRSHQAPGSGKPSRDLSISHHAPGQDKAAGTGRQTKSPSESAGQDQPIRLHPEADPVASTIGKPHSLAGGSPVVDDSALRHLTAKTIKNSLLTVDIGKKNNQSLHIDRSLQLGFSVAPDFASVNSLAGDKPGSIIGITADYQFVDRWYIGTGFLYSKRNYSARGEDYHVPPNYYPMNYMHDVNFVKGSFRMLEIPLNLRYDFSVAGNTSFFASAGLSSYLLSKENCTYYYNSFGREVYRKFSYPNDCTNLFSVVNLSMGVEAGISNSFSLLVAPYMKIPTAKIGFGQVQMNSIGINFALKYAPVLKRKRH